MDSVSHAAQPLLTAVVPPLLVASTLNQTTSSSFTQTHSGLYWPTLWGKYDWLVFSLPVLTYWVVSLVFHFLDVTGVGKQYKIDRGGSPNTVSKGTVIRAVVFQQQLQLLVQLIGLLFEHPCPSFTWFPDSTSHAVKLVVQWIAAMIVMDTYQYWAHRYMHTNKWLYKHVHSIHHRLLMPYAFGALYNHPFEGFIMDTLSGFVCWQLCGLSPQTAMLFFIFATAKTVDDHCGYKFWFDPLQRFPNNAFYHDVHHDRRGIKYNFSQPFFTFWDTFCETKLKPQQIHSNSSNSPYADNIPDNFLNNNDPQKSPNANGFHTNGALDTIKSGKAS